MKKFGFYLVIALAMSVCAFGQAPAKPATRVELTTVEASQMQDFDVKIMTVLSKYQKKMAPEMQKLQDQRKAYLVKLAADHPGYEWHDSTGPADPTGLRLIGSALPPAKPIDKPAASQ